MDHDLIAAGHPRPNFEFYAYLAKMPAHWDRTKDQQEQGNAADAWLVGQVVAAEAAARLLAARTKSARGRLAGVRGVRLLFVPPRLVQAPRFQVPNWRQRLKQAGRRPGSARWGTWYFAWLSEIEKDPCLPGRPANTLATPIWNCGNCGGS